MKSSTPQRLLEELARVRADLDPENLFKILEAALHNPEQQLRFSLLALHVDSLGVIRKPGPDARPVTLIEIEMMEETLYDFCGPREDISRFSCQIVASDATDGFKLQMPESQH